MKYSCIIWDFNGTIADDLSISIYAINQVLNRRGLPIIKDTDAYRKVFGFPVREYYKRLGIDLKAEPYEVPAKEWVDAYTAGISEIVPVAGVQEVLQKIQDAGIMQIILSASEENMLHKMLGQLQFNTFFDKILGAQDIYGSGKAGIAEKFAKESDLDLSGALFIGDTDHDAAAAEVLGCDCLLYSGGHMAADKLMSCGFPVINQMSEVLHTVFS